MYLLSRSVVGRGPMTSLAILSIGAPKLYLFIGTRGDLLGILCEAQISH